MSLRLIHAGVLALALAAVLLSTLDRRARSRLPVSAFVRDGFPWSARLVWPALLAATAGAVVVGTPAVFFTAIGWVSWTRVSSVTGHALALGALTLGAKILLAAVEELVFRGAVLEQIARRTTLLSGVMLSSALFALAHIDRPEAREPLALLTYLLDGLGFSVAYLATGTLWIPTIWHATKNIAIWLLYSESTLQFSQGLLRVQHGRSDPWIGGASTTGLVDVLVTGFVVTAAVRLAVSRTRRARA